MFPVLRAAAKRDWAMRLADRALKPWNPFTPTRYADPYPLYEQVRSAGPMSYQRSLQGWNVVGYAECEEVLRHSETSADRSELISVVRPYNQLPHDVRGLFLNTMLLTDPPDHGRLRKLVNRAFTPRAVNALEPSITKIAQELVEDLQGESVADAIPTFADRLPIFAISDMLGLPRGDWDKLKALSEQLVKFVDPVVGFDPKEMTAAVAELRAMLAALISEREAEPRDDLLTTLIQAEEDGDRLSHSELESMVTILMVAGHETTSGLLGNSLVALHRNPSARDQLREEPEIATNAVEELLRYDSPVQATDRSATADIEIAGHQIKKGQVMATLLGGANRDPRRYDRPNELILDRPDPRPLSFGHGIHHCLGAALARLEARVALPLFLEAFPDYRIDETQIVWKRTVSVRGPSSLPVTL